MLNWASLTDGLSLDMMNSFIHPEVGSLVLLGFSAAFLLRTEVSFSDSIQRKEFREKFE